MALTDDNSMVMPVTPMYGGGGFGNGFGGDGGWWILLLFILLGNGAWGGNGGFGSGGDFPWLMNGQNGINNNVNDGFRDAQLHDSVTSVRDGVNSLATQMCGCCGDIQMGLAGVNQGVSNAAFGIQNSLCQGFAGTTAAITAAQNGVTQQLYSNEIANLNRSFAEQTANTQGFATLGTQLAGASSDNRLGIADLKYTVATENCADRNQSMLNTRDIIDSQTRGTQAILDKLCALELDGVKAQLAQAQRENLGLQNQVNMATMQASQTAQTAQILAGQAAEIDGVYNRLKNCPVGTYPVCNPLSSPSCGCGNF